MLPPKTVSGYVDMEKEQLYFNIVIGFNLDWAAVSISVNSFSFSLFLIMNGEGSKVSIFHHFINDVNKLVALQSKS